MHSALATTPKQPAIPKENAVPALPATTALVAVTAEPATTALATVATDVATPALATVPAEPATPALTTVPTDPATAVLDDVATDPATAVASTVAGESQTAAPLLHDFVTPVILPQFQRCVPASVAGHTEAVETNEYAPGRSVDTFGNKSDPAVLLWHGTQTDARKTLRPFATLLAEQRFYVIVPDWDSHAGDRGRDDLLNSLRYAATAGEFALIGWSLGGTAAAGVALRSDHYDSPVSSVICLAGAFNADNPLTGDKLPIDDLHAGAAVPITLLHGDSDDVVPLAVSEDFAAALGQWPHELVIFEADHGSIAGATYDADADRYCAAEDSVTLDVAGGVVDRIVGTFRRP